MIQTSVIVPCFNEEKHITTLLSALRDQTIQKSEMEIIVIDGISTDKTREIINNFRTENSSLNLILIDNPKKSIPAALNLGIETSKGEYVIRMDAHSIPDKKYIEFCLMHLEAGKADNVGGRWDIVPAKPASWKSRAIAAAVSHPLGAGDALYRYSEKAAFVDTVPFGAFRKSKLLELNCFDENLLSNEDYDLNVRLRRSGGKVFFDPQIRSQYIARANFRDLANQYFRYGYWKRKMLSKYPDSIRLRQAIPPLFVLSLLLMSIAGFFWNRLWIGLGIELGLYVLILMFFGLRSAIRSKDNSKCIGLPISWCIIHFAWAAGFFAGTIHKG